MPPSWANGRWATAQHGRVDVARRRRGAPDERPVTQLGRRAVAARPGPATVSTSSCMQPALSRAANRLALPPAWWNWLMSALPLG